MTDLALARLSAAAYNPVAAGVRRVTFQDISADIVGNVLAIRGTNSFATLCRDMNVTCTMTVHHPAIGLCQAGALSAALGLLDQVPEFVDTFTGHSEGGGIAPILAALRLLDGHATRTVVTWDGVKAGGLDLAATLAPVECRLYRFFGSPVTHWPPTLDIHVREPLIRIGDWTPDPIDAHSIDRAVSWMEARNSVAA